MEQKNNSGSLYRNSKKEKPTHPDYSGTVLIEAKQYRISGWINKSKAGSNYLRLLFSEIKPQPAQTPSAEQSRLEMGTGIKDLDGNVDSVMLDDLPF